MGSILHEQGGLNARNTKFCKFCGAQIPAKAVVCTNCGQQVEELKQAPQPTPKIVINNSNVNKNIVGGYGVRPKNKWVALLLCLLLGIVGGHKFYEGKILMGILYICTGGLCGIGVVIDFLRILFKPNPYFV